MNTDIQYSTSFERITPASAEFGDAEERGFAAIDEREDEDTILELLAFTEPSQWPLDQSAGRGVWFTRYNDTDPEPEDGSWTNYSYHPATEQDAERMIDLWFKANPSRAKLRSLFPALI